MRTFGFGQPDNNIIQLAYVVTDLATAMEEWRTLLRIGPWFVLRQFAGMDPRYRGQPALARCDVAFGFAGHMQYELIHQTDDHPSIYRREDGSLKLGFHHYGMASSNFMSDVMRLEARGFEKQFTAVVPSGGRVAAYDTKGVLPGMIELIESDGALDEMFTGMYRASVDWDGANPVREIAMP
jgi:Glyoxalase/Bleomycin resistance protein/Dioxygenase superfamily